MDFEIDDVCFSTRPWVTAPKVTGLIINFHGLGSPDLRQQPDVHEWLWADAGAVTLMPDIGPWNWMNRSSRAMVDQLIEKAYREYKLADDVPLILTGGSLGGYCALLYTLYVKRPVRAVAVTAAVCNIRVSFRERPDVPRTVMAAFQNYPEDLDTILTEQNPIDRVAEYPDIPYYLYHGEADMAVRKAWHSDPFVAATRSRGLTVEYIEAPGVGHEEPIQYRLRRVEWVKQYLMRREPQMDTARLSSPKSDEHR